MKIKSKVKAGNRCGGGGIGNDADIQSTRNQPPELSSGAFSSHPLLTWRSHMKIKTKVQAGNRCGGGTGGSGRDADIQSARTQPTELLAGSFIHLSPGDPHEDQDQGPGR